MGTKKFYCCATDFIHEMGEAPDLEGRMPLYTSIEKLKELRPYWDERGILEVEVKVVRWIESGCFGWTPKEEEK